MSIMQSLSPYSSKGDLHVIIDIPRGSSNKYEYDDELGVVVLDRVLSVPMHYPFEYGAVPQTLALDGDPLDVLVLATHPTVPGCLMKVRPIGVLDTADEEGIDPKVICVPSTKTDPRYAHIATLQDVSPHVLEEIKIFFKEYKKLEKEKYDAITIGEYHDEASARALIEECHQRFNQQ